MDIETERYMQQLEAELQNEKLRSAGLQRDYGQVSMFSQGEQTNLIEYQLDLREELERIDHLLRGHLVKRDEKGNEYWAEPKDDRLKPFNEYGVQLLLNIISFYLNRNTLLSNYDEEMINNKMKDLGDEIADLILYKYEEMGMNSQDKRKMYPMICRELIDTVHSAYLRALNGGERESLRTARHVTQSNNNMLNSQGLPLGKNSFSLTKPSTWLKS